MKYFLTLFFVCTLSSFGQGFQHFITSKGNVLMDGDEEFRFLSYNIPNLNYVEDEMSFNRSNPYDLPTEYEIRDAMATINEVGGRVIRFYTIPVRNSGFPKEAVTYVEGPGKFNEDAFKALDLVLALANEYGIRIIFSLLNNWQWMGGAPNYAEFRGKTFKDFYTDDQLINDFKQTINFVINRTNTITGVKYKDDKSILCWETGNELVAPYSWTKEIAQYIKSLDNNHLLMDGFNANGSRPVMAESVNDKNIDILSSHHYETDPMEVYENIRTNLNIIKGKKPYVIGEFGFFSTTALKSVSDSIIVNHQIAGGLIWSLRHHHRNGGFYWHTEPAGGDLYKAYHWPGFASGVKYDETNFVWMFREKSFEIQNKPTPKISIPSAPYLLPKYDVTEITWRGSMGASGYIIERTEDTSSTWKMISEDVDDASLPYRSNFHDKSAEMGKSYYYRVKAFNKAGSSSYSNILGPIPVLSLSLIDNMENIGTLYKSSGIVIESGSDRSYKEILYRAKGESGAEIIYLVPGNFKEAKIYAFENYVDPNIEISFSTDCDKFTSVKPRVESFTVGETIYDYAVPKLYIVANDREENHFIKLHFKNQLRVARVEIRYE